MPAGSQCHIKSWNLFFRKRYKQIGKMAIVKLIMMKKKAVNDADYYNEVMLAHSK